MTTTKKEPIHCSLVYNSVSMNSRGQYAPCCNIVSEKWEETTLVHLRPKEKINSENLRNIRKQLKEGVWPEVCRNCELNERSDSFSMRTIWNNVLGSDEKYATEYVNPENIKYLDLTFETICNSKCITCNAALSSFWEEEYNHIFGENKKYNRLNINDAEVDKLLEDFPNVEHISFIGGEPLLSVEHKKYLHKLILNGRSQNIRINYVTNLTIVDNELIDLWKEFKSVTLSVSIDGYGKVNEYIRYPIKWNKTEENLRRYLSISKQSKLDNKNNFNINLSCTISALNFIYVPTFIKNFYEICKEYEQRVSCFLNRVNYPDFMQPNLLPKKYRLELTDEIKTFVDSLDSDSNFDKIWIEVMQLFLSMCEEEDINDVNKLHELKNFITKSDLFRNRSIQDYIPEFWDILHITLESFGGSTNEEATSSDG